MKLLPVVVVVVIDVFVVVVVIANIRSLRVARPRKVCEALGVAQVTALANQLAGNSVRECSQQTPEYS